MFWLAALSVLGVVALGPQVVLGSFKFKLSNVVQCEPVNITFSGNSANNHSVPKTLTILPIADNAAPIYIPIPNGATNSTGITLSFIPLPANTRFLASLDNIHGPAPVVSDVTGVLNSTSAKSDCFASDFNIASVSAFQFDDTLSQCEPFTVVHTGSAAPTITAFTPQFGFAFPVLGNNVTSDPPLPPGSSSYMMDGVRGVEILLLMDNGASQQTTKLITVDGDSNSPKSCFPTPSAASGKGSKKKSAGLSRGAVLGIAIGASVVVVLAIFMLLYILRARRRARIAPNMSFDPALLNQKWPPDLEERKVDPFGTPPVTARSPLRQQQPGMRFSQQQPDTGFVRDPIYTKEKYSGSIMSDPRSSISSWDQFVPADQRNRGQRGSVSSSRLSMNTLDAQDILQMAYVHQDRSSGGATISHGRATPQPSTAGTNVTTFDVAKPSVARLVSTRRTRRTSDPPDMPVAVSRNNSASTAAIAGLPVGYGPTAYGGLPAFAPSSYATFGGDEEEGRLAGRPAAEGVDGIGGFPIPAFQRSNNPRDTGESWGNVVVQ
ncbi:hypothetical protein C8F04DRAFT_1195266 [Mycena alexandri]|uniref:Uncharacterized protein n=1 Tax=Mycena alexandri TaxID=1745969 RepID=A0AAD6S6N8_9AGAR|nr:hypothetical protein C8F04DRAFT_1195266 [Mycena alexandri]